MNLIDLNKLLEEKYGIYEAMAANPSNTFAAWFYSHWDNNEERNRFQEAHPDINDIESYIKYYQMKIYFTDGRKKDSLYASYNNQSDIELIEKCPLTDGYKIHILNNKSVLAESFSNKKNRSIKTLSYFDKIISQETQREYLAKHIENWSHTFEDWFNLYWNNDEEREKFQDIHPDINNIESFIKYYKIEIYYMKGRKKNSLYASYTNTDDIELIKKCPLTSNYNINYLGYTAVGMDMLAGRLGYLPKKLNYFDETIDKYNNTDTLRDYFSKHVDNWKNNDPAIIDYLRKYQVKIVSDLQYKKDKQSIDDGTFDFNNTKCIYDSNIDSDGEKILDMKINTAKRFYAIVNGELYTPQINHKTAADFYIKNADNYFRSNVSSSQRSIGEVTIQYYIDKMLVSRGLDKSDHMKIDLDGKGSKYEMDIKFDDKNHVISKYDKVIIEYNGYWSHFHDEYVIARDNDRIKYAANHKNILYIIFEAIVPSQDFDFPIKNNIAERIKTGYENVIKLRFVSNHKRSKEILDVLINTIFEHIFNEFDIVADWNSNKNEIYKLYNPEFKASSFAILNNYPEDKKIVGALLSIMYEPFKGNNFETPFQESKKCTQKTFKCPVCNNYHMWGDSRDYTNFLISLNELNCLRFCCDAFTDMTNDGKDKINAKKEHVKQLDELKLNSEYEFKKKVLEQYKDKFSKYIEELDINLPEIKPDSETNINFYDGETGKYLGSAATEREAAFLSGVFLRKVNAILNPNSTTRRYRSAYDNKFYTFKYSKDKMDLNSNEYVSIKSKKKIDIYKNNIYVGTCGSIIESSKFTGNSITNISNHINGKNLLHRLKGYDFKISDKTDDIIPLNNIEDFNKRLKEINKDR